MTRPRQRIRPPVLGFASRWSVLIPAAAPRASARWVPLDGERGAAVVTVFGILTRPNRAEARISGFEAESIAVDGRTYYRIKLPARVA